MTEHLIRQGHRKIAFVGTVGETSSITDRFYGYCKAMTEAGIKVTEDMVIPDRSDIGKIELSIFSHCHGQLYYRLSYPFHVV